MRGNLNASKRQPSVFVIHVRWRATSKTIRVSAYTEDVALRKAERMKENAGFWDMVVLNDIKGAEPNG